MDIRVSYIRLLAGDNSRTAPTYTDTQIKAAATLGARPNLPLKLRLAGLVGILQYPKVKA